MKTSEISAEVYQLHVWIRQISPMIWRRILVRSDSTITDLHYTLQIAFGWSDEHLNRFHIHGQDTMLFSKMAASAFRAMPIRSDCTILNSEKTNESSTSMTSEAAGNTKSALKIIWR